MNIAILSYGFGYLNDEAEEYYADYGNDLAAKSDEDNFYVDKEGEYVSGDSKVALGLCREFRRLGHDAVATHYENVAAASEEADLVLTVGPGAVAERYQQFGDADVLFWWWHCGGFGQEPDYRKYIETNVVGSPFDGVLTNGREVLPELREHRPCRHLHIGYDSERLWGAGEDAEYDAEVVYLGSGALNPPELQEFVLEPATEYDLKIYGMGWENTRFSEYHEGILPRGHVGRLYEGADVVLGLQGQYIKYGMVNDRVFQALGTDSVFVDRYHPAFEAEPVADYVNLVKSKSDCADLLADVFENPDGYREKAERGGEYVRENHTYADKCEAILDFYAESL